MLNQRYFFKNIIKYNTVIFFVREEATSGETLSRACKNCDISRLSDDKQKRNNSG